MRFKEGDKPRVRRRKDLLCEFKGEVTDYGFELVPGLNKPIFVASMFRYCATEIEIVYINSDPDSPYVSRGYYWTDDFFEGDDVNG